MRFKFILLISFLASLISCEEPPALKPQDLIDSGVILNSDFVFSAYVDVFPYRSNNVLFQKEEDSTYKIIARDQFKSQRIEISLPYLKVGAYNIEIDSTMTLKFFTEEKAIFNSETERFPSDMMFVISEVDSSGTLYSGSFSATTYLEKTNQPANREFQRQIYTGRFKEILLQ